MKSIYIILIKSNTFLSNLIRMTTFSPYTHVSISFSESLYPLYSFGRRNKHHLLPAGLVTEDINTSFLGNNIPCAVYKLQVSEGVFDKAKQEVERMMVDVDSYHYNVLGLLLSRLGIPYHREKHYFCSQFVSEVLHRSNALPLTKPSSLMYPSNFIDLPELTCIFEGYLNSLKKDMPAATLNIYNLYSTGRKL
ncbi:hypothetical protein [Paenibacillus macquariensis]|uniref:Inositol transport system substrate-binding protein n=1 Tax=Paenibacillus macquariensis TaxID=948756 RepID=A0ABY1KCE9_9BACL|nr:hypothetical protein [Paenibacillus macquariensis]OAB33080.1 hypothetical protein PMSM_16105 [Paenibacillus macquariensis subsp. macquariensis]SIR59596.1 inositol transport system substrate-binding protein [Paenibacillus macquariensis]